MPKKFQGQNTKAVEARQREEERKKNEEEKERIGQEEEWMETDKRVLRQQERLRLRETKRDALATRRAQNKTLLLSEEASSSSSGKNKKQQNVTVQPRIVKQIPQRLPPLINPVKVDEKIQNQKEEKRKQVPLNLEIADEDLPSENINHIIRAQREEALEKILVDASSIEEALEQLQAAEEEALPTRPVDQHPERRSRTAYIAYEVEHLPDVRREYPSLKYSQHRMIMWKQWQKAPENPLNQQSWDVVIVVAMGLFYILEIKRDEGLSESGIGVSYELGKI